MRYMFGAMLDRDSIEKEAERIAPYPKTEPSWAGMYGFTMAAFSLALFVALAGIDFEENRRAYLAFLAMLVVGYAGPFVYFNNQKRRHFRAWARLDTQARERDADLARGPYNTSGID